jgi:hypothetical protein
MLKSLILKPITLRARALKLQRQLAGIPKLQLNA